jgi:hypothetical protein
MTITIPPSAPGERREPERLGQPGDRQRVRAPEAVLGRAAEHRQEERAALAARAVLEVWGRAALVLAERGREDWVAAERVALAREDWEQEDWGQGELGPVGPSRHA